MALHLLTVCLLLSPQNPRILLLFRFVTDVMSAISIITAAASKEEAKAAAAGAGAAAAGAPVVAEAVVDAAAAAAAPGTAVAAAAEGPPLPPLSIFVRLYNVGIVLPTTSASSGTLGATLDQLIVALPGVS